MTTKTPNEDVVLFPGSISDLEKLMGRRYEPVFCEADQRGVEEPYVVEMKGMPTQELETLENSFRANISADPLLDAVVHYTFGPFDLDTRQLIVRGYAVREVKGE